MQQKLTLAVGSLVATGTLFATTHAQATPDLQITEIYEGVAGDDITEDWFELTNFGTSAFTFGADNASTLYYDDESNDPANKDLINGITTIAAGESVIIMIGDATSVAPMISTWGLSGVQVGYADGSGLGQSGDAVFILDEDDNNPIPSATYAGGGAPGSTWVYNVGTGAWDGITKAVDGVDGAYTASVGAGDFGEFPLVGSPGLVPEPTSLALLGLGGLLVARRRRG